MSISITLIRSSSEVVSSCATPTPTPTSIGLDVVWRYKIELRSRSIVGVRQGQGVVAKSTGLEDVAFYFPHHDRLKTAGCIAERELNTPNYHTRIHASRCINKVDKTAVTMIRVRNGVS